MRLRVLSTLVLLGLAPCSVRAEQTRQQQYLDIYLKINEAERLEKQGDFRGSLEDFKDCYQRLAKIHNNDPNWETALVVHRLDDCKAKILELQPKAAEQPSAALPTPGLSASLPSTGGDGSNPPGADSEEVARLKLELEAVKQELRITRDNYTSSQTQLETYRTQLEAVNQQLKAAQNQASADQKMGKLLTQNKELTDKLAIAQKELDGYRTNPKSKLAQAEAQVKNLQDQLAASQETNKDLQNTTTTLKQQLDQANADLVTANQKLVAVGPASPQYQQLKRENEIMRGILTRELQEQAHRDMAKRLYQEEYDRLKLNSKVLQEQIDIVASPMTPPTTDEERQLLAQLRTSSPDVEAAPASAPGNSFAAASGANPATADTNATPTTPMSPSTSAETNLAASPVPPATGTTTPAASGDAATNVAPVQITSGGASTNAGTAASPDVASVTNTAPGAVTPDVQITSYAPPDTTNGSNASAPIAPTTVADRQPPAPSNNDSTSAAAASAPEKTVSTIAPPVTEVSDTTIKTTTTNPPGDSTADPTALATKARLPDDMRETAQQAADLFKNQKYDESAAKYQSIIDKYPESLYAWSNLGVVRFQQRKFDDALKALQQAVKLSPTDAFSYSNLGIVYYQLNQFENAISALNAAKALDPNDPKTHNYLGCACSQKGWPEVAEKEFRKAIQLDPNFGDAHFNLALVYATQKPPSLELARREYNAALDLGIAKDPRLEKLLEGTPGAQAQSSQ